MPAVLGQNEPECSTQNQLRQRRIEKRCVLVRVNQFNPTLPDQPAHAPGRSIVSPGSAFQIDHLDPFLAKLLAEGTDSVETENRGLKHAFRPPHDLGH